MVNVPWDGCFSQQRKHGVFSNSKGPGAGRSSQNPTAHGSQVPQKRFPSKVPRKRFPNKVRTGSKQGSQEEVPTYSEARFPGKDLQATFSDRGSKQGSKKRFPNKVPRNRVLRKPLHREHSRHRSFYTQKLLHS